MKYRAVYRQPHRLYGSGYTFRGVAEGAGWTDSFGNWWINFTTDSGVFFGAVLRDYVTIGSVLSTEQYRDWLTESDEFAGERVLAEMEDRS
jgi:hypothetical protein